MMLRFACRRVCGTIVAMLLCPLGAITAQASAVADVAVGFSSGRSRRDEHSGVSADVTLSLRRSYRSFGRFIAIAGASEGAGPKGDGCRLDSSTGICRGPLTFFSVSALVGGEYTGGLLSAGAAAGPGVYVSSDHITAGGLQARIDLATPGRSRVAFVITGRRSWLPQFRDVHYNMTAVTIGVRIRQHAGR